MSIGIDTNVIARYIVRDDPEQAEKADEIFDKCSSINPVLINQIVLVELIWVLKRLYKYSKIDIITILELILFNNEIKVMNEEEAQLALIQYESGIADFSDYYLAEINKNNDCELTFTFDKKAAKSSNFKLIE